MTAPAPTMLEQDIARLIIDTLQLEELGVADIPPDLPLFGTGLGLDSVDALELALALHKTYQLDMDTDASRNRQHFATVSALAAYVQQHAPRSAAQLADHGRS